MEIPKVINQLDKTEARWFAIYTRNKSEKIVHKILGIKGIESYLPLQTKVRRYVSRNKKVQLPLIPCYLFVKITSSEYRAVLETENVVRFIQFARNLLAIPENEILTLRRIVGEDIPLEIEMNTYQEGDMVEIMGGNLTGLRGKLIARQGKKHFLVELNSIGFSLVMEVDARLLIKINNV